MKSTQIQLEAKLFKGFADQSRLLILSVILDGPKTVTEIVNKTKLSQPNNLGAFSMSFGMRSNSQRKERPRGTLRGFGK